MAQDAPPHLVAQVQPRTVVFQPVHHPEGLLIVAEAALHHPAEGPLPGVAEGGVAQIVAQRRRLGEILVEPQGPGHGPGDAGHLQRVGHAGAVVIPFGL